MAAFSHPNIVSLFDFFEENNTAYIVMELLDGISLKTYLLQNEGKLSCEEMLEVMLPIMDALEEMHKHNIIHRDVSPDNIFLCTGNRMKLIDFGAARFSDSKRRDPFHCIETGIRAAGAVPGKEQAGPIYRCVCGGSLHVSGRDRGDAGGIVEPHDGRYAKRAKRAGAGSAG